MQRGYVGQRVAAVWGMLAGLFGGNKREAGATPANPIIEGVQWKRAYRWRRPSKKPKRLALLRRRAYREMQFQSRKINRAA